MANEEEVIVEEVVAEDEPTDETVEEPKAEKPKRTPQEELKYFEGRAQRLRKDLGLDKPEAKPEEKATPKGELDNADYALLTAKGIEDEDEVAFAHKTMKKWDMPLREVLRDEDFQTKLKSMRKEKEVKEATPSATKRGGGASNDVETALAKYEQTGKLPDDFKLRSAVINAKEAKENTNKPSWH